MDSVSAWTWSATLLQSSTAAYTFGEYFSHIIRKMCLNFMERRKRSLVRNPSAGVLSSSDFLQVVWCWGYNSGSYVWHGCIQGQTKRQWCPHVSGGLDYITWGIFLRMLTSTLDCQGQVWDTCSHSLHNLWIPVYIICLRVSATCVLTFVLYLSLTSKIVGGAATVNALTGMNIIAACFLLPIGIAVYVIFGGLRATFICDWSHTIILFIIIYIFIFRA